MSVLNSLPPVAEGVFSGENGNHLIGGHCAACGQYQFPKVEHCPNCWADLEAVPLGDAAAVYSVTTIRTKPPLGLPQPYRVGYVDLAQVPLRIFCLFSPTDQPIEIGQEVRLEIAPLGKDPAGNACLRPYFSPLSSVTAHSIQE